MSVIADIYIAKFKNNQYPHQFFTQCGHEIAGNFQPTVGNIRYIETFEDFIDGILTSSAWVQLIVCHGDTETNEGMLIKLCKESPHTKIGGAMQQVAWLAEHAAQVASNQLGDSMHFAEFMKKYDIKEEAAKRIIAKLGKLHALKKHNFIVEVRGCSIGKKETNMDLFRRALGARAFSAPVCRQLYVPIRPEDPTAPVKFKNYLPKKQRSIEDLSKSSPVLAKTRRRMFGNLGSVFPDPIVIDVHDIDGHTQVEAFSFMRFPYQAYRWANKLLTTWNQAPTGTNNNEFILPVMWDDDEPSFHVPLESSYFYKIKMKTF